MCGDDICGVEGRKCFLGLRSHLHGSLHLCTNLKPIFQLPKYFSYHEKRHELMLLFF